jgi:hypothetical protein
MTTNVPHEPGWKWIAALIFFLLLLAPTSFVLWQ